MSKEKKEILFLVGTAVVVFCLVAMALQLRALVAQYSVLLRQYRSVTPDESYYRLYYISRIGYNIFFFIVTLVAMMLLVETDVKIGVRLYRKKDKPPREYPFLERLFKKSKTISRTTVRWIAAIFFVLLLASMILIIHNIASEVLANQVGVRMLKGEGYAHLLAQADLRDSVFRLVGYVLATCLMFCVTAFGVAEGLQFKEEKAYEEKHGDKTEYEDEDIYEGKEKVEEKEDDDEDIYEGKEKVEEKEDDDEDEEDNYEELCELIYALKEKGKADSKETSDADSKETSDAENKETSEADSKEASEIESEIENKTEE